jgi:hypothetical protein
MSHPRPFPRGKEALLREVGASIKIKNIQELHRLREAVETKWWESALVLSLFVATLLFLGAAALLLTGPADINRVWMERVVLFCFIPLVFAIVLTLEVLLAKLRALRRLNELSVKVIEAMREELMELRRACKLCEGKRQKAEGKKQKPEA